MQLRLSSRATVVGLAAIATASASAQSSQIRTPDQVIAEAASFREQLPRDTPFVAADGTITMGRRCGTHGLTEAEHAASEARMAMIVADDPSIEELLSGRAAAMKRNRVNTAVHVLHNGDQGNVPQSQIKQQMKVLNRAYKKRGFKFKLVEVTRTDNASWFNGCANPGTEQQITSALAIDPDTTMNIYLCNPNDGSLGWAYLPGSGVTGTSRDAIFILFSTLPGGTAAPYDEGDTGTHEVGHYLGLDHTFFGGCKDRDKVADTPAEKRPAYGCPIGRDTCPGAGVDPVENFMDYSDDSCMNSLTDGQEQRMKKKVAAHRPNI